MIDVTEKMQRNFIVFAWNGQVDKLQEVLSRHPEALEWKSPENGHTALIAAVASGDMADAATDLLLSLNANINAQDDKGMTALMHAATNGNADAAKKLLAKGADTALLNHESYTAAQLGDFKDQRWSRNISAIIRRHDAEQAAERQREIERCAKELTEAEAAQAHGGLLQPVSVSRPLLLKSPRGGQ